MKRKILLVFVVGLTLAFAVACGIPRGGADVVSGDAGGSSAGDDAAASSQENANGAVAPADEPVILTVWDMRSDPVGTRMIDDINSAFEDQFPNVTIERVVMTQANMINTIRPAIMSGSGPDVASYTPGPGYVGVLADAGLVHDLTDAAARFDWRNRFFDFALDQTTFNGNLYGLPVQMDLLVMYYNRQIFADNGVSVPTTYEEFLEICGILTANGVQAMLFDNMDQWPGFHYQSMWLTSFVGVDRLGEALRGDIPWTSEGFGAGLDALYALIGFGYANSTVLSIAYDDLNRQFLAGLGAMRPTGTWMLASFVEEMGDDVGMFTLPPLAGIEAAVPTGIGQVYFVNARSEHIYESLNYMDFIFSPEMIPIWYEGAIIPFVTNVDTSGMDIPPLTREIVAALNDPNISMSFNLDVLLPASVNDATLSYVSQVLAGVITGQEAMEIKENVFREALESGEYEPIV